MSQQPFDFSPDQASELWDLFGVVGDETATEEQVRRLESLLRTDNRRAVLFVRYMFMQALLERNYEIAESETDDGLPPHAVPPDLTVEPTPLSINTLLSSTMYGSSGLYASWTVAYLVATVVLAMGALLGSVIYVSHPIQVVRQSDSLPSPSSPLPSTVARVTGMVDCVFQGSGTRDQGTGSGMQDSPLSSLPSSLIRLGDTFHLASGLLEITYESGVKVVLQGPVAYRVDSADGGFLSLGKLTALVEKRGEKVASGQWRVASGEKGVGSGQWTVDSNGKVASNNQQSTINNQQSSSPSLATSHHPLFTITTPTATVTDLGTEFGVAVDQDGVTETEVFRGTVRVDRAKEENAKTISRTLTAGQAVRVVPGQPAMETIEAKRTSFTRTLPHPNTVQDDFGVARNYLSDGVAGSVWSGILNANTASRLDTLPIEIDGEQHTGRLIIAVPKDSQAGWSEPAHGRTFKNAPYLYIDVPPGDFDARVRIHGMTEEGYSACGLMARRDDDNFVSVNRHSFGGVPTCYVRSEQAGVDANRWVPVNSEGPIALRLVRRGDRFSASYSIDGGQTWQAMDWQDTGAALQRPELVGPIQLGLWYGTFHDSEGSVTFEDFSLWLGSEKTFKPRRKE